MKIRQCFLELQLKMSGIFSFETHCIYIWNSELHLKFCENLNFITFDKLNINLGKTYAKLRIFPKIFRKSGPWCVCSRGLLDFLTRGYGRSVRGVGNRPNRFCEYATVGLRTSLHSTL